VISEHTSDQYRYKQTSVQNKLFYRSKKCSQLNKYLSVVTIV